jgi:chemotaxis protein MotB
MPPNKVIKKGLPPWMATFADLCTLLLTFFVLLLTFANMDIQKFRDMLGSVQMAFGVQFQETGQFQPVKSEIKGTEKFKPQQQQRRVLSGMQTKQPDLRAVKEDREAAESAAMAKQVSEMVNQTGLKGKADVSSGSKGVRLRIKGAVIFDQGKAEIKPEAKKLFAGVAKVMNKFNFYLTVEGHTDALPISTSRFASNWELSSARATAVLRALRTLNIPQSRMAAVGFAANYPLASNETKEGRLKNRRVEFVFTKKPMRVGVN